MGAPLWRASPWVSLWLKLGTVPFKTAPRWRASFWASLWLGLGSVPLQTAPLWRASPWVSLWLKLEAMPLMGAPLWRASPWVSLWLRLERVPLQTAPLWRASFWASLWLTLGTLPFMAAPLWRASPWVSLWLRLVSLPLQTAPLWRASPWVSLWLKLGTVPFKTAPLWRASEFQSHWERIWWEYCRGAFPWQSSPFLQGRAEYDGARSEWEYRSGLTPLVNDSYNLEKDKKELAWLWPCDELWQLWVEFNAVGFIFYICEGLCNKGMETALHLPQVQGCRRPWLWLHTLVVSCFTPMGSVLMTDATKQDSCFINLFSTDVDVVVYRGMSIYLKIKRRSVGLIPWRSQADSSWMMPFDLLRCFCLWYILPEQF